MATPKAPQHLSAKAKAWWKQLTDTYEFEPGPLMILGQGLEAWDRANECREQVAREGQQVPNRFGEMKAHPLLSVENAARAAHLKAFRALGIDITTAVDEDE